MGEECAGIFFGGTVTGMVLEEATGPSIVTGPYTMQTRIACVQRHGQILELKRMIGDLLLNS